MVIRGTTPLTLGLEWVDDGTDRLGECHDVLLYATMASCTFGPDDVLFERDPEVLSCGIEHRSVADEHDGALHITNNGGLIGERCPGLVFDLLENIGKIGGDAHGIGCKHWIVGFRGCHLLSRGGDEWE